MASLLIKRKTCRAVGVVGGALSVILLTIWSASTAFADKFYMDSDMPGYWWNKDPAEAKDEEPPKEQPKQSAKPQKEAKKEPRFPKMSDYTPQDLYDMYPDQFTE